MGGGSDTTVTRIFTRLTPLTAGGSQDWKVGLAHMRRIRLLGSPCITDEHGAVQTVRGIQAWGALARILLSLRAVDRRQLASELFPDTVDPLGAVRWCLAALRRAIGSGEALRGDPIEANLPAGTWVDVYEFDKGGVALVDAGELLEAASPKASAEFETWLLIERQRLAARVEERIRRASMDAIATGDGQTALRNTELGVRRSPFSEAAHVLLVKALVLNGRQDAALAHVEATERHFMLELGEGPSPALRSAARRTISSAPAGISPAVFVTSLIEQGKAALAAGAPDAGIESLRRAASESEKLNAKTMLAQALLELGTALIHAIRGFDEEGAVLVRQAAELAEAQGLTTLRASALRELGYVEALAGRRPAAAAYLELACSLATDTERLAGIHAVIGLNLVDWGRTDEGLAHFNEAVKHARACNNARREIWALGLGARGLIANGDYKAAYAWLDRCLALVDQQRWIAFRPWPVALRAEAMLRLGTKPADLRPALEAAFALSCQLADPCWEGAVSRAMALTFEAEGDHLQALKWAEEAWARSLRDVNRYVALQVDILEDRARLARASGDEIVARRLAQDWVALAARSDMELHMKRGADFLKVSSK